MNGLEKKLKQSFARKEAPTGFADRVLEQIDDTRARSRKRRHLTAMLSRVAAVLLVGTIGTGAWMQHQATVRERREGEHASALVKLALHIASEKTNIARERLMGVDPDSTKKEDGTNHEKTND